ncbi:MAG: site-specific DNA-methyltransferase [Candidatus Methanoplasma sp.]|jgi:adenine-specific DNA-methyltransferase|nr:site-specific DNA-methyltransferase [Candidatus Methanoplasma sp.]
MVIKYVPYFPDPIEGQAILQNFNRTLKYKESGDIRKNLVRGMPLYEVENIESVGRSDSGNMVIRGECVSTCAYLKNKGIEVDLVYIDPPFASGADYAKTIYVRRNPRVAEVISKVKQELDDDEIKSFEEKMYGDVWDKEKYLNWMYENLIAIRSIMGETASIYVHIDWHIGHYVKILMDEIFGESNFINEIIWHYQSGGRPEDNYAKKHDTIYWYSKSSKYTFNSKDVGELRGDRKRNNMKRSIDENGKSYYSIMSNGKEYRYHDDEKITPDDVWDISHLQQQDPERVGYVTQKPEKLLERIICGSSNRGDIIADFFGGSGATASVASKNNRHFIHCDVGMNSIQITRDRLIEIEANFNIYEIKDGVNLYRNPIQTMDKIKSLIPGLINEDSVNEFWEGYFIDTKLGKVPIYVPNLMDSSSRILDEVLMSRILHYAIPELEFDVKKVVVYYIDITNKEEIEKFIKNDESNIIEIELRDLKDILDDVTIDDYVEYLIEVDKKKLIPDYLISINIFNSDRVQKKIDSFNLRSSQNNKKNDFKPIVLSESGLEMIEMISLDCTSLDGIWHSDSEIKIDNIGYTTFNGKATKKFWDGKITSEIRPLRMKIRNICGDESIIRLE